jgi:uncharacterized FAD-dependent dehydrogenase
MIQNCQISCYPDQVKNTSALRKLLAQKLRKQPDDIKDFRVVRSSIDARGNRVMYKLKVEYSLSGVLKKRRSEMFKAQNVSDGEPVIIVGMGPTGIFAALRLIEKGFKPVILERGKPVEERKKDISKLHRNDNVPSDSNYAFGEGGAGTYSDGKLYTRSKKRGDTDYVLQVLHQFGAAEDILVDARPHIGTDKLPGIVKNIRKAILDAGGEVHFNKRVSDFECDTTGFRAATCTDGSRFEAKNIILATGHSATDVYRWFEENNYPLEQKAFAMGVRIEHPQELINKIRYGKDSRNQHLPAAEYKAAVQIKDRGVFTFCMCPGGSVVPASTENDRLVVNGMSNSRRNLKWANAGLVAGVTPEDVFKFTGDKSAMAGINFRDELEKQAFLNGGEGLTAPAQRVGDFVKGQLSADLPEGSYSPGMIASPVHFWLPPFIAESLRFGLKRINKQLKGFITNDAVVLGLESRTSSPVRLPRDKKTYQYKGISGMYPAGEGAGYAGGIVSSAVDGINVANVIAGTSM